MSKKLLLSLLIFFCVIASNILHTHAADKIIKIDGSSTVYPITEAVAEEFQKAKRGKKVLKLLEKIDAEAKKRRFK